VDDERVLGDLPDALAVAVRLRRAGVVDTVVAIALGIPVEGVPALFEVADAKLAQLRQLTNGHSGREDQ
jgi:hypothetical protein